MQRFSEYLTYKDHKCKSSSSSRPAYTFPTSFFLFYIKLITITVDYKYNKTIIVDYKILIIKKMPNTFVNDNDYNYNFEKYQCKNRYLNDQMLHKY